MLIDRPSTNLYCLLTIIISIYQIIPVIKHWKFMSIILDLSRPVLTEQKLFTYFIFKYI